MLFTFGEAMLRYSPPAGERLETADRFDVHIAGSESNVAAVAARLDVGAVWASKLPDSPLGRHVQSSLRSHGVDPAVSYTDRGRLGTYYVDPGGAPRGTDVVYDREMAPVRTATVDDLAVDRAESAEVVHTSGITPALSDTLATSTKEILASASRAGATVSFDINYRSKLWSTAAARETLTDLLQYVDLLTVASRDAEAVLDHEGDAVNVAARLGNEYDISTVVLTRSDAGAVAYEDGSVHEQAAFETETVDAIGTGDALVGGFLVALLEEGDVPGALEYAAATAALKRTIAGDVAIVTPEEVERVVDREGGGILR
jgi:2-dehydro-3-deoxygluconokinase